MDTVLYVSLSLKLQLIERSLGVCSLGASEKLSTDVVVSELVSVVVSEGVI